MPIKIREATENEGGGVIKFTGLALVKPIIVNPNKTQLEKMGIKVEDEPNYISTEKDEATGKPYPKVRFSFYMLKEYGEGADKKNIIVSNSVFLEGRASMSKNGKIEVIDDFGKSSYMDVKEFQQKDFSNTKYLDTATIKAAYVGQVALISLIRNICNSAKEDTTTLPDLSPNNSPKNLFAPGGHSELNLILSQAKKMNEGEGNKIKVMLHVRTTEEGKNYQDIYPYFIGRAWSGPDYFHKDLVNMYKNNNKYFQNRDFGPIDLSNEKVNAEQYRLRIWEEGNDAESESPQPETTAQGVPINENGFPADWETPMDSAPVTSGNAGSEDTFDPFA